MKKALWSLLLCAGLMLTGCGGEDAAKEAENERAESSGSEETGADGMASADESGGAVPDAAGEDRTLTEAELAEYTDWLNQWDNYGFLLSEWSAPEEINLLEVFYSGAGITKEPAEEQINAYLEKNGQEELYTDFWAIPKTDVNTFLLAKTGLSYDELKAKGNTSLQDLYLASVDCFAMEAGDTNYMQFQVESGTEDAEGTLILQYRNENPWEETTLWIESGEVRIRKEDKTFLSNHIEAGLILESGAWEDEGVDADSEEWASYPHGLLESAESYREEFCLVAEEVRENPRMDADASAVENAYVLGDWSRITREALQGSIWYYHPSGMGEDRRLDVFLQFDENGALVYYPAVDFYGDAYYEWEIIDRSDSGLCPELAIYYNGRDWGELAWYILGISEEGDYFWCDGEVFYRQN